MNQEGSLWDRVRHVLQEHQRGVPEPELDVRLRHLQSETLGANPFKGNPVLLELCVLYLENTVMCHALLGADHCRVHYLDISAVKKRHQKALEFELVWRDDLAESVYAIRDAFLAKHPEWNVDQRMKIAGQSFQFNWGLSFAK